MKGKAWACSHERIQYVRSAPPRTGSSSLPLTKLDMSCNCSFSRVWYTSGLVRTLRFAIGPFSPFSVTLFCILSIRCKWHVWAFLWYSIRCKWHNSRGHLSRPCLAYVAVAQARRLRDVSSPTGPMRPRGHRLLPRALLSRREQSASSTTRCSCASCIIIYPPSKNPNFCPKQNPKNPDMTIPDG